MQRIKNAYLYIYNLPRRYKIIGAFVVVALIVLLRIFGGGSAPESVSAHVHVEVASVANLSDPTGPLPVTGKVTSISKANILAMSSGQVTTLPRKLGDRVAAGAVIASFENARERAAVLQAQGVYDAAVAAQRAVSPTDTRASALNTYTSAFNTLDVILEAQIDTFFGGPTPYGPDLLIPAPNYDVGELSRERAAIATRINKYRRTLTTTQGGDPAVLLSDASILVRDVTTFVNKLAVAAQRLNSSATEEQLTALNSARTGLNTLAATLATAEESYRSGSVTSTASTEATVTQALGGLRAAQAALEDTIIRAPISGTIVSLPINKGDYISLGTTVAAISNPGALQVEVYVTSNDAKTLTVGGRATIEGATTGKIAFIAPALDPSIGKIQVRIEVPRQSALTDGDTVSVTLERAGGSTQRATTITIPLAAAKITPEGPVVFTVSDEVLVSHPIQFGEVRGGRVEILSGLTPQMIIVTDARGLAAGQTVVAEPAD